jgi:hypothetical protein
MLRSGFVLYTNALWYFVRLLFGVAHAQETHEEIARSCAVRDWALRSGCMGRRLRRGGCRGSRGMLRVF